MKLTPLFPIVPVLSALLLLATPSSGLSERDGHRHFHKKSFKLPERRHYHHPPIRSNYRPFPAYRSYPYSYGPSFSVSVSRSYAPRYSPPSYSDDLAADVQRELRRRGYYRGSIDGDVGPGTREAIRAYQYDRGLSATGRIDRSLLRALGIG